MRVPRPKHVLFLLAAIAAAAVAAVPQASGGSYSGTNGWIAYVGAPAGGGPGGPGGGVPGGPGGMASPAVHGVKADGTAGTFASSIGSVPSWSASGAKVAWVASSCTMSGCDYSIKVASPNGSGEITVLDSTDLDGMNVDPDLSLSADGTKIAFSTNEGSPPNDYSIWVVDATEGAAFDSDNLAVTGNGMDGREPAHPTFSPDGTKIAYLTGRADEMTTCGDISSPSKMNIWVADVTTLPGTATPLSDTCAPSSGDVSWPVSWSPDGAKIAYGMSKFMVGGSLYTINADGTGKTTIYTPDGTNSVKRVAWSPDGTKIAVLEGPSFGSSTIKVVAPTAGATPATISTGDIAPSDTDPITWGPNVSITGGSGGGSGGGGAPKAFTLKKGKSATFKVVATKLKFTYPRGAVLSATSQSKAICTISKGKVKALKVGTCKVTLKAKPKKGAATTKQVSFSVVA